MTLGMGLGPSCRLQVVSVDAGYTLSPLVCLAENTWGCWAVESSRWSH